MKPEPRLDRGRAGRSPSKKRRKNSARGSFDRASRALTFTTAGRAARASSTQIAKGARSGPSFRASVQKPARARETLGGWKSTWTETTPPTTRRTATRTSPTSQASRWVTGPFYQRPRRRRPPGVRLWSSPGGAWQNGRDGLRDDPAPDGRRRGHHHACPARGLQRPEPRSRPGAVRRRRPGERGPGGA